MQAALRPVLPLLNIELAQRKQLPDLHKFDNIDVKDTTFQSAESNPSSPLSPSSFIGKSSPAPASPTAFKPTEILIVADRFLLLEPVDGIVHPQSKPLRRCIDTVTGDTYFSREVCPHSTSTASLVEAHQRLKDSDVITPLSHVVHGQDREGKATLFLLFPASFGDLHSYLRYKRRLKEVEARQLFRQAAQAVYDCHSRGVVLTDLKLRRFVFADSQRTKLRLESLEDAIVLDKSDSDDGVWRKHGYPAYVTPEVLSSRGARYSGKAADLWSLGIILYTLLVGRYPFQDSRPFGLFTKIIRGHFSVPDFVSSRARCLIRNLLRRDPLQRLEAADILRHPWFSAVLRSAKADTGKCKPDINQGQTRSTDMIVPSLAAPPVPDQVVPESFVDSPMEE